MTTGAERTNFADKRNLPQQRLKDTFFDYLAARLADVTYRAWGSQRGVFGTATLTSAADEVSVGALPVSLLDGGGNVLEVVGTDGLNLKLENALGVTYYVAGKHVLIPSGVERNPRNDVINYDVWVDGIGESDFPDSVVESAGQLNLVVDAIFEAGVSHAGRLATVYLGQAVSDVESIAIERNLVVTWDGSNNRVLTGALLGQAGGSASTSPADYVVAAQGVTIRRNTNLQSTPPYAFIGTATGAGAGGAPPTSVVGQVDITSGIQNNLDESYDASASAAKIIQVDDGALHLEGSSGSGDGQNTILRVSRMGSTDHAQFLLTLQIGSDQAVPFAILQPVDRGAASVLESSEVVDQVGTETLSFTRGGALDLTDAGIRLDPALHVVLVETGPEAGTLYAIKSIPGASTMTVLGLQSAGTPAPWTTGVGRTARVLVPKVVFANPNIHPYVAGTTLDLWKGELHVLRDGQGNAVPIRYFPDGATPATDKAMEWYAAIGTINYVHSFLTNGGRWQIGAPETPAGLLVITNAQGDALERSAAFVPSAMVPLNGDLPSHRCVGFFNEEGNEVERWAAWGNRCRSTRKYSNFIESSKPSYTVESFNGAGAVSYGSWNPNATHGGAAFLVTGAAGGNFTRLAFPDVWVPINTTIAIERVIYARARFRQYDLADKVVKVGFEATGIAYFRFELTVNGGRWEFRNDDGGGGAEPTADTGVLALAGTPNADDGWQNMWIKLDFPGNLITYWMTGMAQAATQAFENLPTGWQDTFGDPFVKVETKVAAPAAVQVGELECWDEEILGGPEE
jgi:hypothetical protein